MTEPGKPAKRHLIREYARIAADYERRWSFYLEATTRETLARLRLRPGDRLLDVGCGTGVLLYRLHQTHPGLHLSGVDAVPEMLKIASAKLPPSVTLQHGWAEQLPFESEQFDVLVSCNMFHYVHEPVEALLEMRRVLHPGGMLFITDWCDDYLACRLCDLYLRLFDRAHFKTYGMHQCARLLRETGYGDVHVERYKINWLWGLMTARGYRQADA